MTHLAPCLRDKTSASFVLLWGYLGLMCHIFAHSSPSHLLEYAASELVLRDAYVTEEERVRLLQLQRFFATQDQSLSCPLDVLVYPPNCEAALLHWRIQQELLNQLDDEQCYLLSSFGMAPVIPATPSAPSTDPGVPFVDCHFHLDEMLKKINGAEYSAKSLSVAIEGYESVASQVTYSLEWAVASFCFPGQFPSGTERYRLLQDKRLRLAFGIHPKSADVNPGILEDVQLLLRARGVVALGEVGIDYSSTSNPSKACQKRVLQELLVTARELGLPVILHCRGDGASQDCLQVMQSVLPQSHAVYRHCFTGNHQEYSEWLEAFPNAYFGVTGGKRPKEQRVLRQLMRTERLLLETDAPFQSPASAGYRLNTPANIPEVARLIGVALREPLDSVLAVARAASLAFFSLADADQ